MAEVDGLAMELAAIKVEDLETADDNTFKHRAPSFCLFFRQLSRLLYENDPHDPYETIQRKSLIDSTAEQLTHRNASFPNQSELSIVPSAAPPNPKKRPNSLSIATPSPMKVRLASHEQDSPRTPDRPTAPKNPDYSGDSIESIDEDDTKKMINNFIDTILGQISPELGKVSWPLYTERCQLDILGFYSLSAEF